MIATGAGFSGLSISRQEKEEAGRGPLGGGRPSLSRIGGTGPRRVVWLNPLNWPLPGPKPAKAQLSIACNLGQKARHLERSSRIQPPSFRPRPVRQGRWGRKSNHTTVVIQHKLSLARTLVFLMAFLRL